MNRRQFTQRLAALASVPAMPAGLVTAATTGVPATAASVGQPYLWAAFVARIHDKASVQMFKRQLSLTDETATQVYNTLLNDGVISAPNAQGVSHAMNPFKRNFTTGMATAPQTSLKDMVEDGLDRLLEDDQSDHIEKAEQDSDAVNSVSSICEDEPDICENPAKRPAQINT
jgi:hypothetical protein